MASLTLFQGSIFPSKSITSPLHNGRLAQWPPMKTPPWRIYRVADLLCYFLKFKVADLLGADLLCTLNNHVLNNTYLDTIPINFQDEVLG